jgi:predicted transcriptional regulator
VLYHLDYLVAHGTLDVRRDGRYKRFFVTSRVGRQEKDLLSALRHAVPRGIVQILLTEGESTQRRLAATMGVSRSTLSFHVSHMVAEGLLSRRPGAGENLYSIVDPDLAARILQEYAESFGTRVPVTEPVRENPPSSPPEPVEIANAT